MNTWKISGICILLTFLCLFTSIGYASFSSTMKVAGEATIEVPEGLFITKVEEIARNNVDTRTVSHVQFSTTVNSIVSRQNAGSGYVTYRITVLNNTKYEYAYRGLYYMTSYGNNSYVSTSTSNSKLGVVTTFPNGRVVAANGGELVFEVTYTVGRNVNKDLQILLKRHPAICF